MINEIINLDDWARNPDIQVLKYDEKTTEYFYRQSDTAGFDITDYQYLLYLNKRLFDFRRRIYSEKHPFSMDIGVRATLYTPGEYIINKQSIEYTVVALRNLEEIYKAQSAQRVGDRAIDGDVILRAYQIAGRNTIRKLVGTRDYVAGGSGESVWLGGKKNSGIEYNVEKHLFTPAEYKIVSPMLRRIFRTRDSERTR